MVQRSAKHRGNISVGGNDHLVPLADIQCADTQHNSIEAVVHANGVLCARVGGKLLFKGCDLFAQHIPAAAKYVQRLLLKFRLICGKAAFEIIDRDHKFTPSPASGKPVNI